LTKIFPIIEGPLTYDLGDPTTGEFTEEGHPTTTEREDLWIKAKTSVSQHLAHGMKQEKDKPLEETLSHELLQWKVFEQTALERFPEPRPWDHAIELKPDFIPKDCKVYGRMPGLATYTRLKVDWRDRIKISSLHGSGNHKLQ
jgi:hypothetical protein